MNCEDFLNYFISTKSENTIKYGLQHSEFVTNVNIHNLIKNILMKYSYSDIHCQQNGMPVTKKTVVKKVSFCTSFDTLIDNLLILFGYEFSKYILYRINSKHLLKKLLVEINNEKINNYASLTDHLKLFIKIFNKANLHLTDKFLEEYHKTAFYYCYKSDKNIFELLLNDINTQSKCVSNFIETKKMIQLILKLILSNSTFEKKEIVINSINDLIFETEFLDVGYEGSFLRLADDLYNENRNNEQFIIQFELKSMINQDIIPNMNLYFEKLLKDINDLHQDFKINLTEDFKFYIINIIIDYFINFGIKLSEYYNIIRNFDKTCRIHFKTIYHTILMNCPKYKFLTESQKTVIHYSILTQNNIEKALKLLKGNCDKQKKLSHEDEED